VGIGRITYRKRIEGLGWKDSFAIRGYGIERLEHSGLKFYTSIHGTRLFSWLGKRGTSKLLVGSTKKGRPQRRCHGDFPNRRHNSVP
jgi:hypothetical protein